METNTFNMEPSSPSHKPAEMQYVTPDSSYRYSASGEDSGYSSVPSSEISFKAFRAGSVSPIDYRKGAFDSSGSSSTPELSSRKTRTISRRISGRCLLSMGALKEEVEPLDDCVLFQNQNVSPGFYTPTKSCPGKLPTGTPSPTKHHPYHRNEPEKIYKSSKSLFKQITRTPPRKSQPRLPALRITSFSELSMYRDPNRPRDGAQHVDFLWCLGRERLMAPALSRILVYLSGEDLIACSMVSKTWQTLVACDKVANGRRLKAVATLKQKKENILMASLSGNATKGNRSAFSVIQNQRLMPPENPILKTPPPKLSPKRFRFELFMKEGLRVDGNEAQQLKPCPRCSLPSLVDTKLNLGVCTRLGCQFRFCTLCHCSEHVAPVNKFSSTSPPRYITCPFAPKATTPPSPPQPAISSSRRRLDLVGSKRSKRNLRRL